jgi:uncharacterized membrane protein YfcA
MRSAFRILAAIAIAFIYALCSFGVAGFGEGWISATLVGFSGCVFLGLAVNNGLRQTPSRPAAAFHLLFAIGSTLVLYFITHQEGTEYYHRALRYVPGAVIGFLAGLAAFYLFPILALLRRGRLTCSSSSQTQATSDVDTHVER